MIMKKTLLSVVGLLALVSPLAHAEDIRIATYNVEHWADKFDTRKLADWAKTQPKSVELDEMIKTERNQDNKDNWMVSCVIQSKELNPDILLIQEGPDQKDLEYFNHRWLKDMYKTVTVFPSNSGRGQNVGMMLKEGFKVVETRAEYYKDKDTEPKPWLEGDPENPVVKENRLFARGPGFVLVETPSGYKFWIGTNHEKSKSGNNVDIAKWRLRECKRVHEIIKEIEKTGPSDVVFGGDMNDELGMQEFEQEAGGDAIAAIIGKPEDGITCATKPLADKGEISFGGYFNDFHRSFIDHMFVTASLKDRVKSVDVIRNGLAAGASDHYPVLMVISSK